MLWAQRKAKVYITIQLTDFEKHNFDLQPEGMFKFQ